MEPPAESSQKGSDAAATKTLDVLGIGLSRLLRYSYGGFLLVALAALVNPVKTKTVLDAMPWEVTALASLVIGAAIYAVHRSVVIPVHHMGLCFLYWLFERGWKSKPQNSFSPTRWLGAVGGSGVPVGRRMLAYSILRRGDFFKDEEKRALDVAHAESGLIVMTAEGFAVAAAFAGLYPAYSRIGWVPFAVLAGVVLAASYPAGFVQHRLECMRFRAEQDRVVEILKKSGIL